MIRTDLAEESAAYARYEGPGFSSKREDGVVCVRIESKEEASAIGKPEGVYYTVETGSFLTTPDAFEEDTARLAEVIGRLLPKTVQICNSGIAPGSGVGNNRAALNEESVGVPVIAVGVPTVAALSNIAKLPQNTADMIVTPREIDQAVEHAARMVAFALNRALYPSLSLEELTALVG